MDDLEFLNLDTVYSQNVNPFNALFTLPNPFRKVKNIYLKSIELPLAFNNVRDNINFFTINTRLVVGEAYTRATIQLANKYYTDINTLLSDINTQLANNNLSAITFQISNNIVSISNPINYQYYFSSVTKLLGTILGFDSSTLPISAGGATYYNSTASRVYNLNYDNYISLYLTNIPHNSKSANLLSSFKIPLNSSGNIIYFNSENISFSQYITITDQNFVVDKLQIVVYDRFGNNIFNAFDYSMTLAFSFY